MNNQDNEKVFQKSQINWFPGHMSKTRREIKEKISLVDLIYEVIDARIPISSRIIIQAFYRRWMEVSKK